MTFCIFVGILEEFEGEIRGRHGKIAWTIAECSTKLEIYEKAFDFFKLTCYNKNRQFATKEKRRNEDEAVEKSACSCDCRRALSG